MIFLLESPHTNAAGKVGGISAIPTPPTLRLTKKASGKSQRSPLQTAHTSEWTRAANAWKKEVTKAEKAAWKTFGNTHGSTDLCGNSHAIPGRNAYMRSNVRLRSLKLPPINAAPSTWTATDPVSITATWFVGPPRKLTITPNTNPLATELAAILARSPQSPGQTTAAKRAIIIQLEFAGTPPPWDIITPYELKWGTIKSGMNIILQAFYCDPSSGFESPRRQTSIVIP